MIQKSGFRSDLGMLFDTYVESIAIDFGCTTLLYQSFRLEYNGIYQVLPSDPFGGFK